MAGMPQSENNAAFRPISAPQVVFTSRGECFSGIHGGGQCDKPSALRSNTADPMSSSRRELTVPHLVDRQEGITPISEYQTEVDQVDSKLWSDSLELFQDANIYQTWPYGAVRWGCKALSHLILKRDGKIVAMAQLRIMRSCPLNAGMAHLRWGPVCHARAAELNPEIVGRMAEALYEEYVRKRGLFLRIMPNAFIGTHRAAAFQAAFAQFKSERFRPGDSYRTLVLNLDPPLDELRRQLDQKWRNQLNRAEKNRLTIAEGEGVDEFSVFIRIYDEMWKRKQFIQSSDINDFAQMQQGLTGDQRLRVFIAEREGVPVAGVVVTAIGDSGIYLSGATSDGGMKTKGAYLLQWRAIQWLKERGVRHYNLGGINPEKNPGVYHFKHGFSGRDVLYMEPMVACDRFMSRAFAYLATGVPVRLRTILTRLVKGKV